MAPVWRINCGCPNIDSVNGLRLAPPLLHAQLLHRPWLSQGCDSFIRPLRPRFRTSRISALSDSQTTMSFCSCASTSSSVTERQPRLFLKSNYFLAFSLPPPPLFACRFRDSCAFVVVQYQYTCLCGIVVQWDIFVTESKIKQSVEPNIIIIEQPHHIRASCGPGGHEGRFLSAAFNAWRT